MTRLNLGCGDDVRDGYLNVDAYPSRPDVRRLDFTRTPWPFADGQFEEVYERHVLEHVPTVFDDDENGVKVDILIRFLEEVYRVLAPEGRWRVLTPLATSRLGPSHWQHYRFVTRDWFPLWRQPHPAARPHRFNFHLESITHRPWRARGDRWFKIRGLGLTLHLASRASLLRAWLATHVEMDGVLRKAPLSGPHDDCPSQASSAD